MPSLEYPNKMVPVPTEPHPGLNAQDFMYYDDKDDENLLAAEIDDINKAG